MLCKDVQELESKLKRLSQIEKMSMQETATEAAKMKNYITDLERERDQLVKDVAEAKEGKATLKKKMEADIDS